MDSQCRSVERPHLLEVACSADPVSSQRGRITSGLPTTRELTDIEVFSCNYSISWLHGHLNCFR